MKWAQTFFLAIMGVTLILFLGFFLYCRNDPQFAVNYSPFLSQVIKQSGRSGVVVNIKYIPKRFPDSFDKLHALSTDADPEVRLNAALFTIWYQNDKKIEILKRILQDKDEVVRKSFMAVLGSIILSDFELEEFKGTLSSNVDKEGVVLTFQKLIFEPIP